MLSATPIGPILGALVAGIGRDDVADASEEIARLLDRYSVLVFPRLYIGDDELVALTRRLGTVIIPPHGAVDGYPEIMPVSHDPAVNIFAEIHSANDFWHTDGTSYERPDKATLLTAVRAPASGEGNTEFASVFAAYDALPESERRRLEGLRVRHSFANAQLHAFPDPTDQQRAMWARVEPREHPLVWSRSDGRASLLIGSTAESVVGMNADESRELLDQLNDWATQPRFSIAHEWSEGDLVIFDNTALLHRSRPYRFDSPRLMHRTTLAGETVVA